MLMICELNFLCLKVKLKYFVLLVGIKCLYIGKKSKNYSISYILGCRHTNKSNT